MLAQRPSFKLFPSEVSVVDCEEIFITDNKGVDRVSPKGAEILLRLYRDSALPMSGQVPSGCRRRSNIDPRWGQFTVGVNSAGRR